MFRRRSLRLLLLFVAAYLLLCSAAGLFIAEATLHPARRPLLDADKTQAATMARRHDAQLTEAALSAFDGNTLRAWQLRPAHDNGDAVILLHGLSDNRMGMIGYAEMLVTRGFTVVLPDARAHGASGGETATFGLLESRDIREWMDWMQDHDHPRCIFGLGESMGAALLLQSLKDQPEFCAVVAESPFSDFREIAYDRVGQYFRTGPWLGRSLLRPIVEIAFTYAHAKYGFDLENVSPRQALSQTNIPVLLIHGQQDGNIPVRHSRAIASHNHDVTLWEVPGADHCGAISVAHDPFQQKIIGWFTNPVVEKAALPHN
jgi:uncharacterized protein